MRFWLFPITLFLAGFLGCVASGCGYTLQNSHSDLVDKEGIHSIYVKPLINNTFKPGIENIVYNALIRSLLSHRQVKLAQSEETADAVLQGTVNVASFTVAAAAAASGLPPGLVNPLPGSGLDVSTIPVATIYNANLSCSFMLNRRFVPPGKKALLWGAPFSTFKPFQSANQLDVPGSTSALINESELDRALSELSIAMMADVDESMLEMF